MRKVYVTGTGITQFGVQLDRNLKDLAADAVKQALSDAENTVKDIQAIYFGNCLLGAITGLESLRGPITLMPLGFGRIPIHNIENACATGASAVHLGWLAVAAGLYDTVLVVGAEKLNLPDRKKTFAAYNAGFDPEEPAFEVSAQAGETQTSSVDRQAVLAAGVMSEMDLTDRHLGLLAAINHHNASLNLKAHRRSGMSYEQIMSDKLLAAPIRRAMMSPISDGAAALVLSSVRPTQAARRVKIVGSRIALRTGFDEPNGPTAGRTAAYAAYEASGFGPEDIDVAEVHDASVAYQLLSLRDTGLCPPAEARERIETGAFAITGHMPVNTSGGQIARGHPIGATGVAQVAELTHQLRGTAGRMQVSAPRVALAHIAGGVIRFETAAAGAHILAID
jgi:acetyl-CoA acyltransferase